MPNPGKRLRLRTLAGNEVTAAQSDDFWQKHPFGTVGDLFDYLRETTYPNKSLNIIGVPNLGTPVRALLDTEKTLVVSEPILFHLEASALASGEPRTEFLASDVHRLLELIEAQKPVYLLVRTWYPKTYGNKDRCLTLVFKVVDIKYTPTAKEALMKVEETFFCDYEEAAHVPPEVPYLLGKRIKVEFDDHGTASMFVMMGEGDTKYPEPLSGAVGCPFDIKVFKTHREAMQGGCHRPNIKEPLHFKNMHWD